MTVLRVENNHHVMTVTIDRPEVRNALSSTVIEELHQLCRDLSSARECRAVIFAGAGDRVFSAGADLKERQGMSEQQTLAFVRKIQATFQEIAELPMPTIAAINGDAFGGGLELALACDMRVMRADAVVGLTEVSLGIIPGAGGTQRLPRLIGPARAKELIFTAKRVGGAEALRLGLVNELCANADETRRVAADYALRVANNAPLAVRAAKEALLACSDDSLSDGLVAELAAYHQILDSDDRKEGLRAFVEKRAAQFTGI